jgi:hypothetical protein
MFFGGFQCFGGACFRVNGGRGALMRYSSTALACFNGFLSALPQGAQRLWLAAARTGLRHITDTSGIPLCTRII